MFEAIKTAPADPILGLTQAFKNDPASNKVTLAVGVYQDEHGDAAPLNVVQTIEQRIVTEAFPNGYLAIAGTAEYQQAIKKLVLGEALANDSRIGTAQVLSGTGGLRVAAQFLKELTTINTVYMSDPTWPNHFNIFAQAGLATGTYPYYDANTKGLHFSAMCDALKKLSSNDAVVLHACCHNPTGIDPTPEQWRELLSIAQARGFFVIFDSAYQGLGDDLEKDRYPVELFGNAGIAMFVINSFSKNLGLYNKRTGGLHYFTANAQQASAVESQVKRIIRAMYSNPPSWGARIVTHLLNDAALTAAWHQELQAMCLRMQQLRQQFINQLADKGCDFSYMKTQKGMFSYTGLSKENVQQLRDKHHIYLVGSGRVNIAGLNSANMDYVVNAIADVV